jgi:Phosphodiester glycosidase
VVVRSGRVTEVRDHGGGTAIPGDGFVVSARGKARDWALHALQLGARARTRTGLHPANAAGGNPWTDAEDVLGAGPRLVSDGAMDITDEREKMIPSLRTEPHPRTAIGVRGDGRVLLLTADGRRPPERVGLTLDHLAQLLIELGAREAINLDGGGSTTMVVKGTLVNFPTDATGERPVSDAVVVRSVRDRE